MTLVRSPPHILPKKFLPWACTNCFSKGLIEKYILQREEEKRKEKGLSIS